MLQAAHDAGRLDVSEYNRRLASLRTAQSTDQLAALTADLPPQPGSFPASGPGFPASGPGYPGYGPGYPGPGFQGPGYSPGQPGFQGMQGQGGRFSGGARGALMSVFLGSNYYLRRNRGGRQVPPYRRIIFIVIRLIILGIIAYFALVKHQWVIHGTGGD